MKKIQYTAPDLRITKLGLENMIAGSITEISGATGLSAGGNSSDAGVSAGNVKQESYNVWDDDWSKY